LSGFLFGGPLGPYLELFLRKFIFSNLIYVN
jgi:hypothetical protein